MVTLCFIESVADDEASNHPSDSVMSKMDLDAEHSNQGADSVLSPSVSEAQTADTWAVHNDSQSIHEGGDAGSAVNDPNKVKKRTRKPAPIG